MSTIPVSLTERPFNVHIYPHLNTAKRGYKSKIPLYKVFNYILYRLHTSCQWYRLSIDPDPDDPEKKKSVGRRCTIIFASGAGMEARKKSGNKAL